MPQPSMRASMPMSRPMRPSAPPPAFGGFGSGGGAQGTLRVNSRPWSQVYVDGRMIGNTPQLNVQLRPGNHRVKLQNPDLRLTKQFTINVKAGQVTTKIMNLVE